MGSSTSSDTDRGQERCRKARLLRREHALHRSGIQLVAGIDEAGRGPLAGPVVAAAVVFPPGTYIPGVDDSKKLSPARREELYEEIQHAALSVGVGIVEHSTIDEINILNATFLAMHRAIDALQVQPEYLLIDGNRFDGASCGHATVIGGDACCFSIAAASIVAKVTRDRIMTAYDDLYPGYGFAHNKGYPTQEHREILARRGCCAIHRRSFSLHGDVKPSGDEESETGEHARPDTE